MQLVGDRLAPWNCSGCSNKGAVLGVGARKQCGRNSHFFSQFALLFPEGQEVLEECDLSKGQEVEGTDNAEELKEHSQSNGEAGGTVGVAHSGGCPLAFCASWER